MIEAEREQLIVDKGCYEAAVVLAQSIRHWRKAKGEYWAAGSAREKETLAAILKAEGVMLDALENLNIAEELSGYSQPPTVTTQ